MGDGGQAGEVDTFFGDCFGEGQPIAGQRMPAPRFRVAFDQRVVLRVEKQQLQFEIPGAQCVELRWQPGDAVAAATIDHHADLVIALLIELLDKLRQQLRGEVVHAIVVSVLQHFEGNRFSGTGEAANEHEMHVRKDSGVRRHEQVTLAYSRCSTLSGQAHDSF
jgi:hypothetical protein